MGGHPYRARLVGHGNLCLLCVCVSGMAWRNGDGMYALPRACREGVPALVVSMFLGVRANNLCRAMGGFFGAHSSHSDDQAGRQSNHCAAGADHARVAGA